MRNTWPPRLNWSACRNTAPREFRRRSFEPSPYERLPGQGLDLPYDADINQLLLCLSLSEDLEHLVQLGRNRAGNRTRSGHARNGVGQPLLDLPDFRDGLLVQSALNMGRQV